MSRSQRATTPDEVPDPASSRVRRLALWACGFGCIFALLVLAALILVSRVSDGEVSVLIGERGSEQIGALSLLVASSCLALGLCLVTAARSWLALTVLIRIGAFLVVGVAAGTVSISTWTTVVPLIDAGCETGYWVEERSFLTAGSGKVLRQDGLFVTMVHETGGDDGHRPFREGAYVVVDSEDSLLIWSNQDGGPAQAQGAPAFSLPKRGIPTPACGIAVPSPTSQPSPALNPEPLRPHDGAANVRQMLTVSLAASVGPARGADGAPIDPQAVPLVTNPCHEGGTRYSLSLSFATMDNATSLERILRSWEDAGYDTDRAIQADIRYSKVLPLESMSVRDTTTIDGLIHLGMTSRCSDEPPSDGAG